MTGQIALILGVAALIGGAVATRVATDTNDRPAAAVGMLASVAGGATLAVTLSAPAIAGATVGSLLCLGGVATASWEKESYTTA